MDMANTSCYNQPEESFMNIKYLKAIGSVLTAGLLISATSVWADLNLADGGATGSFFNPERSGEGMWVEVSDIGGGKLLSRCRFIATTARAINCGCPVPQA